MKLRHLLVLGLAALLLTACSLPGIGPTKANLTYWGLFEGPDVFSALINDYHSSHPNVTIDYSQKSFSTLAQYKETVLTRLKEGKAGDILRVQATWVKDLVPYLATMPSKTMSLNEFSNTFYPAAREALVVNGQIYGVPLEYDGLLLLANKTLLDSANIPFPKTWDEFRDAAAKLTKTDTASQKLNQAGAAIGLSSNIPYASDILSLMFLQAGLKIPNDIDSQFAADALTFYSNFYKVDKVWDSSLPPSTLAFARGQVAFIFAPSWEIIGIKAANPGLSIVAGPPPQVPDLQGNINNPVNLASFWVEVVAKNSQFKNEAFDFLKFLSSADSETKMYALESAGRLFGEAYSRKDLASSLSADPYLGPLLLSAPQGKLAITVDNSGNDRLTDVINRAITDVSGNVDSKTALTNAKKNLQDIISGAAPAAYSGQ